LEGLLLKAPTEKMLLFMEADKTLKQSEITKKTLRPEILGDLREDPKGFTGITYQKKSITKFNHENFFNWVKRDFPNHVESLREDKIDYMKFEEAYASGRIDYEEIPGDCYTVEDQDVLIVSKE
jgi:uncharacterized membrane-anchored protein